MNGRVFVSYRRDDSQGSAGRLYDRLAKTLGRKAIFFDVENIGPGLDFVDVLKEQVSSCSALIAVIGAHWSSVQSSDGVLRLYDPDDFVRIEIETALERRIPVVPVLVDGAKMPNAELLPEGLKKLTRRNAIELSHIRFDFDADRLFKGLRHTVEEFERLHDNNVMFERTPRYPLSKFTFRRIVGISIILIVVGCLTLGWFMQTRNVTQQSKAQAAQAPVLTPPLSVPAANPTNPNQPADPSDRSTNGNPYTQEEADNLCATFNYQDLIANERLGIDQLKKYRDGLRSNNLHFSRSMAPTEAAKQMKFGNVFAGFYGDVVVKQWSLKQSDPNTALDSLNDFNELISDQELFLRLVNDKRYSPVITYMFMYDQGLCYFADPPRYPSANQLLNAIVSKNLQASFSDESKVTFERVYKEAIEMDKADQDRGFHDIYLISYYWILAINKEVH